MPSILINEMRGLNTSRARLQLAKGELSAMQNVRQRPFDNWAKRRGIETALVQDSPVNGIFEWDFDEIVMPMYEAGGTLTFYPQIPITTTSVGGSSTKITPSPSPVKDPLDPTGTGTAGGISFGLEQAMRAIQERICRRGGSPYSWPNGSYDATGAGVTIPCATVPLSTFYGSASTAVRMPQSGLYQYDCYYNPTYKVSLVQSVVDVLDAEATGWLQVYPEGQTTLTTFTSSTLWGGTKPTATASNFLTVMGQVRNALNGLGYYEVGATWTNADKSIWDNVSFVSCSTAKTNAAGSSPSWVSSSSGPYASEYTVNAGGGVYQAHAERRRAKATQDLTNYKGCTGALFLKSSAQTAGYSNVSDCPVVADGKYHLKETGGTSGVYTSAMFNDNSTCPTFSSSCPVSNPGALGWSLTPTVILNFRFTY